MHPDALRRIGSYVMPEVPLLPSDLGFLFGTRHGVEEFCLATMALWERGMFRTLLVSGGCDRRRSILAIGKVCSLRRYLMTLERHWPGLRISACRVDYFGVEIERWHEHAEFRRRVLAEFEKIPACLRHGFLSELDGYPPSPLLDSTAGS